MMNICSILGCFVCPFPKSYLAVQPRIFVKTCNLFKANGIPVIDADIIARAWVEEGCREDILLESGELDRPKLGRIVFGDPSKLQLLNRYTVYPN
uniref:Putative dephospho-CoA kinase, P-loop containing nucleoside triphosphate hydrolase n=1 Tax=Helianthus annuus TaxID=4232 RepID=A0A251V0C4_HELAN